MKGVLTVRTGGRKYPYCPGKATWDPEIVELFHLCRVASQTGILPAAGGLEDQSELFASVYPDFAELWWRNLYGAVWKDVQDFTKTVLESIFGKK